MSSDPGPAVKRRTKFEGLSLEPVALEQTRSLRGRTVKIETPPCSNQLSTLNNSETAIDGTPGDNTRSLRGRTVTIETPPCSAQLSTPNNSETAIDGTPGDNTRSLRGRTIKIETSPCSTQLSTPNNSETTINKTPGDNIEEQAKLTAEGIPEDWIKEVKPKRNNLRSNATFYVDPKTGYAFHSLEDAVKYIQTGSILSCMAIPQKRSREDVLNLMKSSETRSMTSETKKTQTTTISSEVKLNCDGLPGGWIKELKPRKKNSDRKDTFYIDPKTGYAFLSLKDALRYLETGDVLNCATKPRKRSMEEIRILSSLPIKTEIVVSPTQPSNLIITDDEKSGELLQCNVVRENELNSYGLPTSWIKELKPRKDGSKMDPFYIDPDTRYAFSSLKDALRYLATGNIRSCVMRPRQRSVEELHALMTSCKMSSTFGMKTVKQESVQCVDPHTLSQKRKRKRSPMEPLDLTPDENPETEAMKAASRREKKQRREKPLFVRASPRLLSLKTEPDAADENHEENNNNNKEVIIMAENDGMMISDDALLDPSSPSLSNPNIKPSNQSEMMEQEERTEWANGSHPIKIRSRGGLKRRERRTPTRASSRLAAQKATNDAATSVENDNNNNNNNSMMSIAIFEPNSQPETELNGNKTKEGANNGTSVEKNNDSDEMMSGSLVALPSPSNPNFTLSNSEHEFAVPNEKTIEGANNSRSTASLRRVQMQKEIRKLRRASSHFAAVNNTTTMSDVTRVKKENHVVNHNNNNNNNNNTSFNPSPSFSSVNAAPLKEEEVPAARSGSLFEVSSQQSSFKANFDSAGKKGDENASNCVSEPPITSSSRPDLNLESASSPVTEFEEMPTAAANGRVSMRIVQKEASKSSGIIPTSDKKHGNDNKGTYSAGTEVQFPTAHPDLNFGPTSQPHIENKKDLVNKSAISRRAEPHHHKQLLTCNQHRPDLNLGPSNQSTVEQQHQRTENPNPNSRAPTGSIIRQTNNNVRSATPAPAVSMSESPSCYNNYVESNFKISNYFSDPVEDSPSHDHANRIIMGSSTNRPNPVEVRLGITNTAPSSSMIANNANKTAPDLNMVPISWPETIYNNPKPSLEHQHQHQQQPPAGVINTVGEFHLPQQQHVHSDMLYQDPTMDALLSGHEMGINMQHMSIDALNSPGSPFYGDFWHDPCLSYAFKTLSGGGTDQRQRNSNLEPQNNVNWVAAAGARNNYPNQNSVTGVTDQRQQNNPGLGSQNNINWVGARNISPNQNHGSVVTNQRQQNNTGLGSQNNVNWAGASRGATEQRPRNLGLGHQNNVNEANARNGYPNQNPNSVVTDQRQLNSGLGSQNNAQNNVNWAGARNGYPNQNPSPGITDQRQLNSGFGPQNNVNWGGSRNIFSSQNPSPSASASRTQQNFNFGMQFPKR